MPIMWKGRFISRIKQIEPGMYILDVKKFLGAPHKVETIKVQNLTQEKWSWYDDEYTVNFHNGVVYSVWY